MPPKAVRGRCKKLAGKYRNQKRKAEEIDDLEVHEDSIQYQIRERRGRKSKKDISPCTSNTQQRSSESSISPPRSAERSPQRPERSPQRPERSPQPAEMSPQQSKDSTHNSPSPPPSTRHPESSDDEDESASSTLPEGTSKRKQGKCKGDKGKGKTNNENPPPGAPYSFTQVQEEEIARWLESKKLLYDIKDKQYKDKALRRQLWEGKAAEYGTDCDSIQRWYKTQRTRFSKLREGQPKKKSQKRSGDGLSSGDEEDPVVAEEASENDSDRDKFIRRAFGFLKLHIRRTKKDTPASFKDKLALADTGELAGSDDSIMAVSLADENREHTKYTGYPTPRPPSKTRIPAEDRSESPSMEMKVTGASSDLQARLVQFITREQQVNITTPFCKYLEAELDRLHDTCLEPAYEEITLVLNHYRKVSKQFRMSEASGDQISPFEDVPSAFQSQQQRPVAMIPVSKSATYSRVGQLQQESALPSGTYYSASRVASSPSAEFQPCPSQWPRNPPPASVWRSQDCGYVEQTNQQYNLEQQQQYHTLQPSSTSTQGYVRRSDSPVVWESLEPRSGMPMVTRVDSPSPRESAFVKIPSPNPQQQLRGPRQLTPQQPVQRPAPPPIPDQKFQHHETEDSLSQFINVDDSVNINKTVDLSASVLLGDNKKTASNQKNRDNSRKIIRQFQKTNP